MASTVHCMVHALEQIRYTYTLHPFSSFENSSTTLFPVWTISSKLGNVGTVTSAWYQQNLDKTWISIFPLGDSLEKYSLGLGKVNPPGTKEKIDGTSCLVSRLRRSSHCLSSIVRQMYYRSCVSPQSR
ncbi:hypothetical protein QLX08_010519 [Tetragonisca angustula]|uniref:Uncharacterized protein n=1 Tax=Tetragonisca angustula TaxID=166442 RepID=A0AAW0ZEM3_9HYME